MTLRIGVLASGSGTTLEALLAHEAATPGGWTVASVVTDRACLAEERGDAAGRPVTRVSYAGRSGKEVEDALLAPLTTGEIAFVVCAGFLRLIPPAVVAAFPGRIVNIHPSLLPLFGGRGMYGRHVHAAVLEAGMRVTGTTIHRVDEVYDRGAILAQWPVPVVVDDTVESLAARVQEAERALLPAFLDAVGERHAGGTELLPPPFHVAHPFHSAPGREPWLRSVREAFRVP